MGKTTLATLIFKELEKRLKFTGAIYIPDDDGRIGFFSNVKVQILDEVHKLKNPEMIYPYMDSGKYIYILACNEFAKVKEPLVNRCMSFIFENYTDEELSVISRNVFKEEKVKVSDPEIKLILGAANGVPREVINLSYRLIYGKNSNPKLDVKDYLENTIGIENGLNSLQKDYLHYLAKIELAGLDTVSYALRLDRDTIRQEVEPDLIFRGFITIGSRGRRITSLGLKEINKEIVSKLHL